MISKLLDNLFRKIFLTIRFIKKWIQTLLIDYFATIMSLWLEKGIFVQNLFFHFQPTQPFIAEHTYIKKKKNLYSIQLYKITINAQIIH